MRVPPFRPCDQTIKSHSYDARGRCDHLGEAGAKRGAAIIMQVWRQAGHTVNVPVREVVMGDRTIWITDMSELPNGLPAR